MSKIYTGTISEIHKNSGVISMGEGTNNAKVLFYIFPDMLKNNKFCISEEVSFKLANNQIRGGNMKLALDVTSKNTDNIKEFTVEVNEATSLYNYNEFIYKKFYGTSDTKVVRDLIEQDRIVKEVTLKWILFIESKVKNFIVNVSLRHKISSLSIYSTLNKCKETKSLHNKIMKKLKKDYSFRNEFELLTIKRDTKDDKSFEIEDVPLALYLEETTLDELGKILKILVLTLYKDFIETDNNVGFLRKIYMMFLELSKIRNASAHGNLLIPLILDDTYMPSELYDLQSFYPEFNSGSAVTEWELFEPIRFFTRQLTKRGIAPMYQSGLQFTGLYTAKYILINPVRRSFFSFIYIMNYLFVEFEDINEAVSDQFYLDFVNLIPLKKNKEKMSSDLFTKYPKDKPVTIQITKFIYFLMDPIFFNICDHFLLNNLVTENDQ